MTLVDLLRSALERPDARCGPPVDMWAAALRPSDVQQQPERKPAPVGEVLVILGISTDTSERRLPLKPS